MFAGVLNGRPIREKNVCPMFNNYANMLWDKSHVLRTSFTFNQRCTFTGVERSYSK